MMESQTVSFKKGAFPIKFRIIGDSVLSNILFLHSLVTAPDNNTRKSILKSASPEELLSLVESCHNILSSNFPIKTDERAKMIKYKHLIRKLGASKSPKSAKIIAQKGSGGMFAALLAPILTESIRYFINKRLNKA